jgi:hypothetical protein
MEKIKNLLQHVELIKNKYEEISEITGENFNIFDILNINSDEVKHSLFISYLLDSKGKHNQKDLFLKLFIDEIQDKFESEKNKIVKNFNTEKSFSITEKHIGFKSEDISNGGRIDVVINDGQNNIIIENKIYAGDQEKQLFRYYNYDKEAPLIYLTLGDELPTKDSITHNKETLQENFDFISISYKNEIKKWIQSCIKAVYNKPLIRETLMQYEFLINELTNQSNNKMMEKEIMSILKKDLDSVFLVYNNVENLKDNLFNEFIIKLKIKLEEFSINLNLNNYKRGKKDDLILIKKNNWFKTELHIAFYFESNNLFLGIWDKNIDDKIQDSLFKDGHNEKFQIIGKKLPNWYLYGSWHHFNYYNSSDFWKNIQNENFIETIKNDLITIVDFTNQNIFNKIYKD